jgi:hypothetical protein
LARDVLRLHGGKSGENLEGEPVTNRLLIIGIVVLSLPELQSALPGVKSGEGEDVAMQ